MVRQALPLILASQSPRRQELLKKMGLEFSVVSREVDESYPLEMDPVQVPLFLAEKKALAFDGERAGQLLITADTVVILDGKILGKPAGREEAIGMLESLSGRPHEVITGVSLFGEDGIRSFSDRSRVYFTTLSAAEIRFYTDRFRPFDKAGAYGIQEWIGYNKITRIEGSYTNIVGLPTEKLFRALQEAGAVLEEA